MSPAKSQVQQKFFGAALGRAKAGHPAMGDPKMPMSKMAEFAGTKRKGLPKRAKGSKYKRMAKALA